MDSDQERLYETMHVAEPKYRNVNQGLIFLPAWIDLLGAHQKVIEVGCGNGLLCEFLVRGGHTVVGVDIAQGIYQRIGYPFYKMAALEACTYFAHNEFDVCLCFDVLEHLPKQQVLTVLPQMVDLAPLVILSVACYEVKPLHLTVETPGWWLDNILELCPNHHWQVRRIVERDKKKYEGHYAVVFCGRKDNNDEDSHTDINYTTGQAG